MTTPTAILLPRGEGRSYWVLGDLYTFKATGRETAGAYCLIEQEVGPQSGPPPHVHHAEEEAFYVLEGRFSFLCGEEERVLEKGGFAHIPRGMRHTFRNLGDSKGRLLVSITPAGFEEFFFEIGSPAGKNSAPPAADPEILNRILQLAPAYHMEVLLPED